MALKDFRFSEYRVMWVLVFFDLPTATSSDKRSYTEFRKFLLRDGFEMYQFSFYARVCASVDNAKVHIRRVKANLPKHGKIGVMCITDKQFSSIEFFSGQDPDIPPSQGGQLDVF